MADKYDKTEKLVRQNTGFIISENQRAIDHLAKVQPALERGDTRTAKYNTTAAETHTDRAQRAAKTIEERTRKP